MRTRTPEEWSLYDEALIVELDTESAGTDTRLAYRSPDSVLPGRGASHVFKACSWDGSRLTVAAQTEVLVLDGSTLTIVSRYSHRWFNDLHHAAWLGGRLRVVSTGLDSMVTLNEAGEVEEILHALEGSPWSRFGPDQDFRRLASTKPHGSHPNFVFATPHGLWLTRFEQRDAICLADRRRRIPLAAGGPHDGIVLGSEVWFTTVNGYLIRAVPDGDGIPDVLDLRAMGGEDGPLGWCRGLCFADGLCFVGFSRIRRTRFRRNLSWMKHGFRTLPDYRVLPTRVAAYDLRARVKRGEWELEGAGLNAVFGIVPARPPAAGVGERSRGAVR